MNPPSPMFLDLAREVQTRRIALGLTQTQLGALSGISQGAVSEVENAAYRPVAALELVVRLAHALGCTPDDLVSWPDMAQEAMSS